MEEAIAIFVASLMVVILVRIPRYFAPTHYFELHEMIHGMNNVVTLPAIAVRFAPPLVVALATAIALRDTHVGVGTGVGLLSSILLIWPALLDRRLLPWQVVERKQVFYLLLGMFVMSFTLLGVAGGFLGVYLEVPIREFVSGSGLRTAASALGSRVDQFLVGIAVFIAATLLTWAWRRLHTLVIDANDGEQR